MAATCSVQCVGRTLTNTDGRWVFVVCSDSSFVWGESLLRHLNLCSAGCSSVSAAFIWTQRPTETLPSKPSGLRLLLLEDWGQSTAGLEVWTGWHQVWPGVILTSTASEPRLSRRLLVALATCLTASGSDRTSLWETKICLSFLLKGSVTWNQHFVSWCERHVKSSDIAFLWFVVCSLVDHHYWSATPPNCKPSSPSLRLKHFTDFSLCCHGHRNTVWVSHSQSAARTFPQTKELLTYGSLFKPLTTKRVSRLQKLRL